jgi:tight adherence protein C
MALISVLAFISIALATIGVYYYIRYREALGERLKRIGGRSVVAEERPRAVRGPLLKLFRLFAQATLPKKEEELSLVRRTFLKAGYRGPHVTALFYGGKALLAMLLFLLFTFIRFTAIKGLPYFQTMFFSILSGLTGFYLPNLWIHLKISQRKEKILRGFPDALDLLVTCVEAGLGLDAAMKRVGEEIELSSPVLSEELQLMAFELRAGKSRQDALRGLALRTELEDVSSLVTLLVQTDRFGTSVAQALRVHSDAMRTRRRQRAEEVAARMSVKMTFPLIFFIFPSMLLVVVGPAIIRIARTLLPTLGGG